MGRLNDILIDLYSRHYARVSITFDDPQGTAEVLRDYETQFGDIVRALPAGSEVADLGCGIGMMVAWLATIPGVRPVGVDGSAAQIEIARKNLPPTVEVHCMQLEPFLRARPARFGAIFAINILEHIPGDDNVLALTEAVRDALVPGGVFVCSVPNAASLTSGYSRYMNLTHFRAFTTTYSFSCSKLRVWRIAKSGREGQRTFRKPSGCGSSIGHIGWSIACAGGPGSVILPRI